MRFLSLYIAILLFTSPVYAGFLDDLVDKAKQTADEVVGDSFGNIIGGSSSDKQSQTPKDAESDAAVTSESKVHSSQSPTKQTQSAMQVQDKTLVKSIQQQLKEQGYPVGVVDGLYGAGTKKAIAAYQEDQGITVDGLPSQTLLNRLQETQSQESGIPSAITNDELPEPTIAGLQLAAVHFRPKVLDNETLFKDVLLSVHPEFKQVVSNEFKWHKQKGELKERLLREAKNTPLRFDAIPWRESSVSKARPVELKKYDFEKSAYFVRFATGNFRTVLLKMLIPGDSSLPAKYPDQVVWLPMNPDTAEQISNYFDNKQRRLFLRYRFKVVGTDISSSRPVPVIEFENNQLEFYAMKLIPQGNQMKTEYKLMAKASILVDDAVKVVDAKRETFDNPKASDAGVIKNADIDGVKLGMEINQALHNLQSQGIKMGAPGPSSKLTGVTIKGDGKTADGMGWVKVMIRQIDGRVYQYEKTVGYLLKRLPLGDGTDVDDLEKRYKDAFISKFSNSRYSYSSPYGNIDFDDETQPPYNKKVTSPHITARVSAENGRFTANINMHWKKLVGANW